MKNAKYKMKSAKLRSAAGGLILNFSFCIFHFAFAVLSAAATESPDRFSIIVPADGSLVEGDTVSFVIKVNKSGTDAVRISRKNRDTSHFGFSKMGSVPIFSTEGRDYFCKSVPLDYGPNEFVAEVLEKGRVAETKKLTVFYRSDISKEFRMNPPGFQRKPFHTAGMEAGCAVCHRTAASDADIKPARPEQSLCYACHKMITARSNVHGPAARWDCLTCHERNSDPVKYSTAKPDKVVCFTCHKEKQEEWRPRKFVHGPTATGKCTICHNPHASNNEFWLRKPAWDLCVNCHEDRASGAHIVVGFGSGAHPVKDRPDPLRPGKEFSCASCHNPHASDSKSLFVNNASDLFELCKTCHKDK